MKNRCVIMVYRGLDLGGIETLIIRFANYLADSGTWVLVVAKEGPLKSELKTKVEFVPFDRIECAVPRAVSRVKFLTSNKSHSIEHWLILSFDPLSVVLGTCIERGLQRDLALTSRHITGVFHPRAYFHETDGLRIRLLNSFIWRFIARHRCFFMNQACFENHDKKLAKILGRGVIIPVPIGSIEVDDPWVRTSCSDRPLKIVSVGRLVPFKGYNLGAPRIVEELYRRGLACQWDVYGDGELEGDIRTSICKLKLGDSLQLKGSISYTSVRKLLKNYDLFVGMGTAAVEAAAVGIPVVCAIDTESELCFGFINKLPLGVVGEKFLGDKKFYHHTVDVIERFSKLPPASVDKLSNDMLQYASMYSLPNFDSRIWQLSENLSIQSVIRSRLESLISGLYIWVVVLLPNWIKRLLATIRLRSAF